jgi:hypothetical protein
MALAVGGAVVPRPGDEFETGRSPECFDFLGVLGNYTRVKSQCRVAYVDPLRGG